MSHFSSQSRQYIRWFKLVISLYPPRHQREYGPEMLQLLEDNLHDVEQLSDPHILRETFLHSLLGIPGSLVREYFSAVRGKGPQEALRELGVSNWRLANYLIVFFLALNFCVYALRLETPLWELVAIGAGVKASLVLLLFVFVSTRRLFLTFLVLGTGIILSIVGSIVESGPIGSSVPEPLLLFSLPFLGSYLLATLFHRYPDRFRRPDLSTLSATQVAQLKSDIRARRRRNARLGSLVLGIFLVLNMAGLYDPARSTEDLGLPVITVPDQDNMYFILRTIPEKIPAAQEASALQSLSFAATKPIYQDPVFANLGAYATAQQAASISFSPLGNVRAASALALVQAESRRQAGDLSGALANTAMVIRVGDAIESSQDTFINIRLGSLIREDGLTELEKLVGDPGFSADHAQSIKLLLAALHPSQEGAIKALKVEFFGQRLFIQHLRRENISFYPYPLPASLIYSLPVLSPFLFQPNRTVAAVADKYRLQVRALDNPCAASPLPAYPAPTIDIPQGVNLHTLRYNGIGQQFVAATYSYGDLASGRCTANRQVARLSEQLREK